MSSEGTHRTSSYQREKQQSAEYFHNVKLQKQNKKPHQKDPSELEIRLCAHRGSYVPSLGAHHQHNL